MDSIPPPSKKRRVDRVAAACDTCKSRKVKCNGTTPCTYCISRDRAALCTFSGPRKRATPQQSTPQTPTPNVARSSVADGSERNDDEESWAAEPAGDSTVVPLEARLLPDGRGKLVFIGDSAPLSFLQTVRHLITSQVDPDGFPGDLARAAVIEMPHARSEQRSPARSRNFPDMRPALPEYIASTHGLIDLFDNKAFDCDCWDRTGTLTPHCCTIDETLRLLVLAIGYQGISETLSEVAFERALKSLTDGLCTNISLSAVQGFTLVAVYMLRASQPNGAYLYFSLAARVAYAIGLHRVEVNASSGQDVLIQRSVSYDAEMDKDADVLRNRIWKSLRVIDMLLSNTLGRPPSTSDVDCTVKYHQSGDNSEHTPELLDASVQIFMIVERVVIEVYSRKRISLRIADYISQQLKAWASRWLRLLTNMTTTEDSVYEAVGACQVLCSYYYCIMLLTRPFLIYNLYEYLGTALKQTSTVNDAHRRQQFAGAALDAAIAFTDCLGTTMHVECVPKRLPLIASWLFTTSLVLAISILGPAGEHAQEPCQRSISFLRYFGDEDPQARKFAFIADAIMDSSVSFAEKRRQQLSKKRREVSSQLFGMLGIESRDDIPSTMPPSSRATDLDNATGVATTNTPRVQAATVDDWTMYDGDFFSIPWLNEVDTELQGFLQPGDLTAQGSQADVPLFQMNDPLAFLLDSRPT